eukprot:2723460-Pleurochrysis_carterae.AAC.2
MSPENATFVTLDMHGAASGSYSLRKRHSAALGDAARPDVNVSHPRNVLGEKRVSLRRNCGAHQRLAPFKPGRKSAEEHSKQRRVSAVLGGCGGVVLGGRVVLFGRRGGSVRRHGGGRLPIHVGGKGRKVESVVTVVQSEARNEVRHLCLGHVLLHLLDRDEVLAVGDRAESGEQRLLRVALLVLLQNDGDKVVERDAQLGVGAVWLGRLGEGLLLLLLRQLEAHPLERARKLEPVELAVGMLVEVAKRLGDLVVLLLRDGHLQRKSTRSREKPDGDRTENHNPFEPPSDCAPLPGLQRETPSDLHSGIPSPHQRRRLKHVAAAGGASHLRARELRLDERVLVADHLLELRDVRLERGHRLARVRVVELGALEQLVADGRDGAQLRRACLARL